MSGSPKSESPLGFSYDKYRREKKKVKSNSSHSTRSGAHILSKPNKSHVTTPNSNNRIAYNVLPPGVRKPSSITRTKYAYKATKDSQAHTNRRNVSVEDRIGDYHKGERIGAGTFGDVYLALSATSGRIMALKEVQIVHKEDAPKLVKEISLLASLQHPNIVRYLGSRIEGTRLEKICIFCEWLPGGSLKSVIKSFKKLPMSVVRLYTTHILCGLKYLHESGVAHRDLKCENVLISDNGMAKLADFGQATKRERVMTRKAKPSSEDVPEIIGTPYFMAPEVIRQERGHNEFLADVWSMGGTILEMATSHPPWYDKDFKSVPQLFLYVSQHEDEVPHIDETLPSTLIDLIQKCFRRLPKDRPHAGELIGHRFVLSSPQRQSKRR